MKLKIELEEKEIQWEMEHGYYSGTLKPVSREQSIQALTEFEIKKKQEKVLDRFRRVKFEYAPFEKGVYDSYIQDGKKEYFNWVQSRIRIIRKKLPVERTIKNRFEPQKAKELLKFREEVLNNLARIEELLKSLED